MHFAIWFLRKHPCNNSSLAREEHSVERPVQRPLWGYFTGALSLLLLQEPMMEVLSSLVLVGRVGSIQLYGVGV